MISQSYFNDNEISLLQKNYKLRKRLGMLSISAGSVVLLLGWFAMYRRSGRSVWPYVLVSALISVWVFYFVYKTILKPAKQDLLDQTKLSGHFVVTSKSEKNKLYLVYFDVPELKMINVERKLFDNLAFGDSVYIEFAKNSKYVFKIFREEKEDA
jgi:hypothetical protein